MEKLADAAAVEEAAASLVPLFAKAHRADFAFGSELIQGAPGQAEELAAGMMVSELWHGGNVGRLNDL